jgi:hypothetical protein
MLTFLLYLAIACFIALAILGHILVLQALFRGAGHAAGKSERRKPPGISPRLPV